MEVIRTREATDSTMRCELAMQTTFLLVILMTTRKKTRKISGSPTQSDVLALSHPGDNTDD